MLASFLALRRMRDSNQNWLPIKITGRVRLNRSAELILVEVDGRRYLLGSTTEGVTKIATLDNVAKSTTAAVESGQRSDA